MDFDSVEELYKYVKASLKETLEQEIAEKIIELLMERVQTEVFDVYEPKKYQRRTLYGTGGLGSRESFVSLVEVIDDTIQLEIENIAEKVWSNSSRSLAELIEYGEAPKDAPWLQPRPFFKVVKEELKSSNLVEEVLLKALNHFFK